MVTCQEWRCYRRLSHLRHGLHDPIKVLLGKPRQNAMVSKSWELTRPSSPRDVILKKIDLLVGSVENMGVDAEIYIYIYVYVLHINWCRILFDVFVHLPIIYTLLKFLGGIWKYRMISLYMWNLPCQGLENFQMNHMKLWGSGSGSMRQHGMAGSGEWSPKTIWKCFQRGDYLSKNMQVVVANKSLRMPSPSPIGDDLFGQADLSSKWCNHH